MNSVQGRQFWNHDGSPPQPASVVNIEILRFGLAKSGNFCERSSVSQRLFTGTYTAIVTPFEGGKLDEEALDNLVKAQIAAGVDGIVPVGTTGESPTLDYEEHVRVIEAAINSAGGKIKVLAGTGGNSTTEAVFLTKAAADAGAAGSLQVAPYYNKPTQEGLFQHFKAIADATKLPLVLYSIPGRCGIEIAVETVKRLTTSCKTVIGIKEAGGAPDRVSQLREALDE